MSIRPISEIPQGDLNIAAVERGIVTVVPDRIKSPAQQVAIQAHKANQAAKRRRKNKQARVSRRHNR